MMKHAFLACVLMLAAVASYAADCPAPPTTPAKGTDCTNDKGFTWRRITDVSDGPTLRVNDYSRRQAFNSDKSRILIYGNAGSWHLYNATTYAYIKSLTAISGGPGGDAEIQWNPSDPDLMWFMANNGGLQIKQLNVSTDAVTTVADLAARVQAIWADATWCSTKAEGSPSSDGRYWGFVCGASGFAARGLLTYDMQTDTILGHYNITSNPDNVSMSVTGRYLTAQWYGTNVNIGDGYTAKVRAFTRDLTDWTYIGCISAHSDNVIGGNGHDYYISGDYSTGGDATCTWGNNGKLYKIDIDAGWVSHGYATRTEIEPLGYSGTPDWGNWWVSGKAFDVPGLVLFSAKTCGNPADCNANRNDNVFTYNLDTNEFTVLGKINVLYSTYYTEPHGSISRDGSKVIFNTNWGTSGTAAMDAWVLDLPLSVTIITTTLPGGTQTIAYSQQIAAWGGTAPRTFGVVSGALPTGLSLSSAGLISGTPTEAGTFDFTVRATDAVAATDDQALTIEVASVPTVTTTTLSSGYVGLAYYATVSSIGGKGPYSYAVSAGTLPTGISLSSDGVLSGTPTTIQTANFTVRVTDANANTDTQALSLDILSGQRPTLKISAGSDTAVATVSYTGLPHGTSCGLVIADYPSSPPVATITSASGGSSRVISVTDLTPSHAYTSTVTCGSYAPSDEVAFTTRAAAGSGTYALKLKPTAGTLARMTALDATLASAQAAVYWKAPGESNYTATKAACSSGCTITLSSLASGVHAYYIGWESNSTAIASSVARPAYVPIP